MGQQESLETLLCRAVLCRAVQGSVGLFRAVLCRAVEGCAGFCSAVQGCGGLCRVL